MEVPGFQLAGDPTVRHPALSWGGQRFKCPPVNRLQQGADIHYGAELQGKRGAERAWLRECRRGESGSSPRLLLFYWHAPLTIAKTKNKSNPEHWLGCARGGGGFPPNQTTPLGGIVIQTASARGCCISSVLKSPGSTWRDRTSGAQQGEDLSILFANGSVLRPFTENRVCCPRPRGQIDQVVLQPSAVSCHEFL